ncbi:hypothetical protein Pogu_0617 [Pyrobaculum oguniense TE7]|uniref:Uncharacterized protein n=1 Tax=Pyrobaculum oguniense (strain DSM 13380 / JCM 10595 / TE7) TaxID=698757 RepID=H6Q7Y7_PYROT|nr:hypothetical protein Pogu_0617 [Pyrobaculum oguniense TE7]
MKIITVVGPPGSGKTLVATSVAIYLYLASASTVYIDATPDKTGAKLVKNYVPLAADIHEARDMDADYAVIDAPPYEVPRANYYVVVLEQPDLKVVRIPKEPNVKVVANKLTSKWMLWRERLAIPYDPTIAWSMQEGYPPLAVANVKSWRRIRNIAKEIGDAV